MTTDNSFNFNCMYNIIFHAKHGNSVLRLTGSEDEERMDCWKIEILNEMLKISDYKEQKKTKIKEEHEIISN